MKIIFFIMVLLLTGCQEVQKSITFVKQTSRIIHDDSPNWVKKIKNNEIISKRGYKCYQTENDAFSNTKAYKVIQQSLYSQIGNEILSMVSSSFQENTSYNSGYAQKNIHKNINIKSFADISGVHISNRYYDKLYNKAYGYVCISDQAFNDLKKDNNRKHKEYILLIKQLKKAINKGDKEKAKNIISKIKINIPAAKNMNSFKKLEKQVNRIIKVNISLSNKYKLSEPISTKIISNKIAYINIILKHNGVVKLLVSNFILTPNKVNRINLIKRLSDWYKGNDEIDFFITKTSLDITQFTNINGICDYGWSDYIDEFKNEHFIKILKYNIIVQKNNTKICLINKSSDKKIFFRLKTILSNKSILSHSCKNKIIYYYKSVGMNNQKNIKITLKLYKKGKLLDRAKYIGSFYKTQQDSYRYILPDLLHKITEFQKEL